MSDEHNEIIMEIKDGEEYKVTTLSSLAKKDDTQRGFGLYEFTDRSGKMCTIQDSSLATEPAIYFGIHDADPQILASVIIEGGTGWAKYPLPKDVFIGTRMHLTQEQVKALLPMLTYFAETGEYIRDFEETNLEP